MQADTSLATWGCSSPAARTRPVSGRRLGLALAGAAALTLLGVGTGLYLAYREPPTAARDPTTSAVAAVVGRWVATVKYEWGDTHEEQFEFRAQNGELSGTADYLGRPVPAEQISLDGSRLSFVTRSQESMGGDAPWKEVTHRYSGDVMPDAIRFTLVSAGGYTLHRPLSFVARRARP